jgi:hypothetical protein
VCLYVGFFRSTAQCEEKSGHRLIPSSFCLAAYHGHSDVPSSDEPFSGEKCFSFLSLQTMVFATDLASETNWSMVSRSVHPADQASRLIGRLSTSLRDRVRECRNINKSNVVDLAIQNQIQISQIKEKSV